MNGEDLFEYLKSLSKEERRQMLNFMWWSPGDVVRYLDYKDVPENHPLRSDRAKMTELMDEALRIADGNGVEAVNVALDALLDEYLADDSPEEEGVTKCTYSMLEGIRVSEADVGKAGKLVNGLVSDSLVDVRWDADDGDRTCTVRAAGPLLWKGKNGTIDEFLEKVRKYQKEGHAIVYREVTVKTRPDANGVMFPFYMESIGWVATRDGVTAEDFDDVLFGISQTLLKSKES